MALDIFLYVAGSLLIVVGFLGCILPILPGIPLSYGGILLLHFSSKISFSTSFLVIWLVIVVVVQVLDYYIPIWGTRRFGGSKWGMWGSAIGVVVGLFFSPLGIIIMPFVGAFVGEIVGRKPFYQALRAAVGSFVGFFVGTLLKFVVAFILGFYFFKELFGVIV